MKIKRSQLIEKFDTVPPNSRLETIPAWLPDTVVDFNVKIELKCLYGDDEGYIGRLDIFSPFMGGRCQCIGCGIFIRYAIHL